MLLTERWQIGALDRQVPPFLKDFNNRTINFMFYAHNDFRAKRFFCAVLFREKKLSER
jgi:hypothetical protein